MATREELVGAIRKRYSEATRTEKIRILDEFVAVTGFHRKHAMRLLREERKKSGGARAERRIYDDAAREALIILWEAADRICAKRLRPLIPLLLETMERHGHIKPDPTLRDALLRMSAATIDRALIPARSAAKGARRRRGVAATALRRSIPIRTFNDWEDPAPGHFEADLVSHSGPVARGSFAQTLVLTDIATGWTECAPLLFREQSLLTSVLDELRRHLPMTMLGFDTDNDSVFLNETVRDWCAARGITFTRCRPYRKNDQAWVEQKNGAIVRRMVGYHRYEGLAATTVLAELYAAVRLYVNFFQPSFKLAEKQRDGARVIKRHHAPATPCQRLLADPRTAEAVRDRLVAMLAELDPVRLLHDIRRAQERLAEIADIAPQDAPKVNDALDQFLMGLRTAWREGGIRPTSPDAPKRK